MKKLISNILIFTFMAMPATSGVFANQNNENYAKNIANLAENINSNENSKTTQKYDMFSNNVKNESKKQNKDNVNKSKIDYKKFLLSIGAITTTAAAAGFATYNYYTKNENPNVQFSKNSANLEEAFKICTDSLNECTSSKKTWTDKILNLILGEAVFFLGSLANNWLIGKAAGVLSQLVLVKIVFF